MIAYVDENGNITSTPPDPNKRKKIIDAESIEVAVPRQKPVEAADLKPNTRVFVRAGKNLGDQIEAYQIIWGEILHPTQPR